jgi:hypothetical protein
VAQVSADGLLTLWSSTQITHYVHRALASVLEWPAHRIRVIQPCLGGAFGGKSDPFSLEFCVAKLAQVTGRPVKMLWTREEVFYAHRGRHPMQMHFFGSNSLFEFERMLMEIGAMGKVIPGKATEVYIKGNFEYTVEHEISISHNDELCIHPLFSGIFGKTKKELPVYPYGGGLEDEDYRGELE